VSREKLKNKRQKWLLQASCFVFFNFAFLVFNSPARADRLQSWRFDASQNRLDFITDEGVQPRAQLVPNPDRLVIDLPGINFGRPATSESFNGAIRSMRVAQFERGTTRIVLELAPGYSIDPSRIQFRGATAQQWSVQLPQPQFTSANPQPGPTVPPIVPPTVPPVTPPVGSAKALLTSLQPTTDGLFIRVSGSQPEIRSLRTPSRQQMIFDLYGATISPNLSPRELEVNRNGISRVQVAQYQSSPPVVRITLSTATNSPNWQANANRPGEIVLLPQTGANPPSGTAPTGPATIQSVNLQGNQLLIRANQPITYTTGWDRATGQYRIGIPSAQLEPGLRAPQPPAGGPLLRIQLRQEEGNTVGVLMTPAAGVQIGSALQPDRQQIVLPFQRGLFPSIPPGNPGNPGNPGTPIPIPPRPLPGPGTPLPRPIGRQVVVLDPGHGGPDPGAVGIGNIYEKDIVLDVSRQVSALLEQQGVQVVMTRNADIDLDLEPRVQIAQRANANIFVSIHANAISMSRPDINGLETFYYDSGLELAQTVHASILQATGARDRRVRQARFYVIRRTTMPAILVELGFVTGAEDAPKLATPGYRRQLAEGLARGILQYLR
jgi:N-acetylmuramoyl-L-alanine amidase